MAAVKRINSDYTITNKDTWLANVTVATHTMFVQGNLLVGGNTTQVTKTDLSVTDNLIVLNSGETGSGVSLGRAGIEVDRGTAANVQLIYDEVSQKWSLTNDGITYFNIVASSTGLTAVYDDKAPRLGGNLDVLSRTIFSSNTQQVKLDSNLAVKIESVNTPTAIAGYNTIYASTPGVGQTGLYQTSLSTSDELISKSKAVWYSLIM